VGFRFAAAEVRTFRVDTDIDLRLAQIARAHLGVVTVGLAADAGVALIALRRRAAAGTMLRLACGAYAIASVEGTWEQQLHASLLVAGPNRVRKSAL
jgi:hypothetical protein